MMCTKPRAVILNEAGHWPFGFGHRWHPKPRAGFRRFAQLEGIPSLFDSIGNIPASGFEYARSRPASDKRVGINDANIWHAESMKYQRDVVGIVVAGFVGIGPDQYLLCLSEGCPVRLANCFRTALD